MLLKLFFSFIKVGLFSVGGGYAAIPLIQNQIVEVHNLMSMSEFADLITIAEMTPGPISINSATFVGNRLAGPIGGIICTLGCVIPAFIICLILARLYYKYRGLPAIQIILSNLRPAVVALICSAGVSILTLALFQGEKSSIVLSNFRPIEFTLFIGGIFSLRKFKLNPILVIFGSGIIGTLTYFIL